MRHAWLIALCGCRSILGFEDVTLDLPGDGRTADGDARVFEDAQPDATVPNQVCFGKAKVKACVNSPPVEERLLSTMTIDTSNAATCTLIQPQAAPPSLCVIVALDIVVPPGATVRVVGSRPLVLIAAQMITIDGTLDAASRRVGGSGAGAGTGSCPGASAGGNGNTGAGAGAGGALGGSGGGGGSGGAAPGGTATSMPMTAVFRGGCAGARGGDSSVGLGGSAGAGGGAIYLLAGESLRISGTINASGAGAGAPGSRGGGGGGGSGGMIGLEAQSFMIAPSADIYAVGGGGASGGGSATSGSPGPEATGPAATASAPANGTSGSGGIGGSQTAGGAGAGGSSTTGGGGGGGSAGIIWSFPQIGLGGQFAPQPRLP